MIEKNHEPHFISILGGLVHPTSFAKKKTPGTSGNPLGLGHNGKSFKIPWFQSAPASYGYLDCLGIKWY